VVFDIGGGIPNNKRCKAVQIGGPSGGCVPEAHLDIATDYEVLKQFGLHEFIRLIDPPLHEFLPHEDKAQQGQASTD
jgi:hypothetical protein